MAILLKKHKLHNGIVTDLYVKMYHYRATANGIQCICSVFANLEERKKYNPVQSERYFKLSNPSNQISTNMNPKAMWDYVYTELTKELGGTIEDTFSENLT